MRTGDIVLHVPSQEKWTIAFLEGDRLYWRGWPQGYAAVKDCKLVRTCTDVEHGTLLREMANMQDRYDPRCQYARKVLNLDIDDLTNDLRAALDNVKRLHNMLTERGCKVTLELHRGMRYHMGEPFAVIEPTVEVIRNGKGNAYTEGPAESRSETPQG